MVALIRRNSGLLVPVGAVDVDESHPLATGLVSFYVPKLGLHDLGPAGVKLTAASGWGAVASSRGGGQKGATTSQQASVTTPLSQQIPLPLSVFWHGDPVATSTGNCTYFGTGLNSAASPFVAWEVGASGTGTTAQYNINTAGSFNAISGGTMPTNKPFSLGMAVSGSGWRAYMSGRVDGTPQGGQSNPSYTGTYSTTIGTYAGATTRVPGKITNAAGLWRRVLTDSDFAWLEAEPFAFLQVIQRRQYYLPAGGGSVNSTLTAATGAFTLTGNAAGLKVSHTLVAAPATFTLTGNAAGLKVGHTLVAGSGAFTFTGNAAGLKVSHTLVAEPTAYALTGFDAALNVATHTYSMAADTGVFTLTGNAANLTATSVSTATAVTGGWVDPRIARQIIREAKAYHKAHADKRADQERRRGALFETLDRVYAEITGEALPVTAEAVAAEIAKPAETPSERVSQAVAVYAAVARLDDAKAMRQALGRLDKELMAARIAAAAREEDEILRLVDEYDRGILEHMTGAIAAYLQLTEEAHANLRL